MKFKWLAFACVLCAVPPTASTANAALLSYSYSSISEPEKKNFTFTLDDRPPFDTLNESNFVISASDFTQNGVTIPVSVIFWVSDPRNHGGGGFDIYTGQYTNFYAMLAGPQLFNGSTSSPALITGNFDMFEIERSVVIGRLSIIASAVPEPQTWTLLLLGFGGLGYLLRRRTTTTWLA